MAKNLKGSTILEVLIAATLICISITMFAMTYARCEKSNSALFRLKAVEIAEKEMYKILKERSVSEYTTNVDHFVIDKKVLSNVPFSSCYTIILTIYHEHESSKLFTLEGKILIEA